MASRSSPTSHRRASGIDCRTISIGVRNRRKKFQRTSMHLFAAVHESALALSGPAARANIGLHKGPSWRSQQRSLFCVRSTEIAPASITKVSGQRTKSRDMKIGIVTTLTVAASRFLRALAARRSSRPVVRRAARSMTPSPAPKYPYRLRSVREGSCATWRPAMQPLRMPA
jgi:hypothetical protein